MVEVVAAVWYAVMSGERSFPVIVTVWVVVGPVGELQTGLGMRAVEREREEREREREREREKERERERVRGERKREVRVRIGRCQWKKEREEQGNREERT